TLRVESAVPDAALKGKLAESLQAITKLKDEIELVAPNSLPNDGKVIADERSYGYRRCRRVRPPGGFKGGVAVAGRSAHLRRHRLGAVAVFKGRRLDLLELNLTGHHLALPGLVLGMTTLKLGHHLAGKQGKRFHDVLVRIVAGLVEQDHLIDMRAFELAQLIAQGLGGADQPAPQPRLLGRR